MEEFCLLARPPAYLSLHSDPPQDCPEGTLLSVGWTLPPQSLIKKMPHSITYNPTQWRHLLNYGSFFPDDCRLCSVDKNTNQHRDFTCFSLMWVTCFMVTVEKDITSPRGCHPRSYNFWQVWLLKLSWNIQSATPGVFWQPLTRFPLAAINRITIPSVVGGFFPHTVLMCLSFFISCLIVSLAYNIEAYVPLHRTGFPSTLPIKLSLFISVMATAVGCCSNTFHISHHGSLCN